MAAMMKDAWSIFSPLEGVGEWEAVVFAELWLEGYELIQATTLISPPQGVKAQYRVGGG